MRPVKLCQILKTSKPWVVSPSYYKVGALFYIRASCSMASAVKAVDLSNTFPKDTLLSELTSNISVEFGNSKRINTTQTLT